MSRTKILTLSLVAIVVFSIIGVGMSTTVSANQYEFDEPTVSAYKVAGETGSPSL